MSRPDDVADMDNIAEKAERGRVFYEIFPGTAISDRWLNEFEHADPNGGSERVSDTRIDKERQR